MKKIGMGLRIVLLAGVLALALAPGAASLAAAASGGSGGTESADRIAAMNPDERAQYFEQAAQRVAEAERKLAQSKALYLDVPYSSIDSKLLDAKLAYDRAASDDSGRDAAQLSQQVTALEALPDGSGALEYGVPQGGAARHTAAGEPEPGR
ncbi:hypothetical protein L5D93_06460 [Paenibacillus thiaminolyticus]|nr:hypothetical protein [Paenibacillus thiaminolyticus]